MKSSDSSWENVSDWYGKLVGKEGSYYQQRLILPRSLKLLDLKSGASLLDLACGQGVLGRQLPPDIEYAGLDTAPTLVNQAKRLDKNKKHVYKVADVSKDLPLAKRDFTHAALLLALQNIRHPEGVIQNAEAHLRPGGKLLLVLNHPCFRIPRQSSWGIDERNKTQYRRVDRYMSPLNIPIATSPGRGERSEQTWSYHSPLSDHSSLLFQHHFAIIKLEEWLSDKRSAGEAAKMENRARAEFPLFLAILARKE